MSAPANDVGVPIAADGRTAAAQTGFQVRIPVRFQHVDPASLVFYPRYFEMINQVVEDWFQYGLGLDFRMLHIEQDSGVPTVHVEMEFPRPARLGDVLIFTLHVLRLGETSVDLDIRASNADHECLRGRSTLVFVDARGPRAKVWPSDLRRRMAGYLMESEAS